MSKRQRLVAKLAGLLSCEGHGPGLFRFIQRLPADAGASPTSPRTWADVEQTSRSNKPQDHPPLPDQATSLTTDEPSLLEPKMATTFKQR
ncbi:hypothetical protein OKW35_009109 [Paraburkholderia sp. MM5477-R1]